MTCDTEKVISFHPPESETDPDCLSHVHVRNLWSHSGQALLYSMNSLPKGPAAAKFVS